MLDASPFASADIGVGVRDVDDITAARSHPLFDYFAHSSHLISHELVSYYESHRA